MMFICGNFCHIVHVRSQPHRQPQVCSFRSIFLVYKNEICIQHHFPLSTHLSSKHIVQTPSNLSMAVITSSQHTNNIESITTIAHGQGQPSPGEHMTSDGYQKAPIPNLVESLVLDKPILKQKLSIDRSSGMLYIQVKINAELELLSLQGILCIPSSIKNLWKAQAKMFSITNQPRILSPHTLNLIQAY